MKFVEIHFHKFEIGVLLTAITLFLQEPIPEIDEYVSRVTQTKLKLALDKLKKESADVGEEK